MPTPANYRVKRLNEDDLALLKKLIELFNHVFETSNKTVPDDSYLLALLQKREFIAIVAVMGSEVVGGLTAYEMPLYYSNTSEAYLYDIAVTLNHRARGIGKKLIEELKGYCRQNNINLFFVEAEMPDKEAVDFYHALGGKAQNVVHFNFPL